MSGRVVVVTGAGTGFGRQIALTQARRGDRVFAGMRALVGRNAPKAAELCQMAAAEGFNLTWTPEEGLDVAARHGLRGMLTSELLNPATLEDASKRAQLDAQIDRVKRHPALEAYFLTDEPSAGAFLGLEEVHGRSADVAAVELQGERTRRKHASPAHGAVRRRSGS